VTITNGYATLAQLKARMAGITTTDDTLLEEAIQSASREIDKYCGRRFYLDSVVSARVYRTTDYCLAEVDDFATSSGLIIKTDTNADGTYATTWASTDYELLPLNGIVDSESGWPYRQIRAIKTQRFLTWTYGRPAQLQVTAKWGWAAVPDPVYQACLIMAQANYKLKDQAFGTIGLEAGIVTVRQVPAAMVKLNPYRKHAVLVA
jgi:hypothetical protein